MGFALLRCSEALYGIDIKWVREFRPSAIVTPVFGMSPFWVGITALRGNLYSVLDLEQFLFSGMSSAEKQNQVVFTAVNDLNIGLLVEEMEVIRQIDHQSITTVPSASAKYILGRTPDHITILDLPILFADPRLKIFEDQPANQMDV
ncbi:MAG: chemotaxis protein CheW [Anaerolineales bacterium]|nr:chemotaxis protein CheW [Anaerolineales bacterium]